MDHGGIEVAFGDAELSAIVRQRGAPRAVTVVDVAPLIALVSEGFENWATEGPMPEARRRGRPPVRRSANAEVAA